MKVSQLIEILRQMPQDATVLTACSNHSSDQDDAMAVGVAYERNRFTREDVVVIGDWTWIPRHPEDGPICEGTFRLSDGTYLEERKGRVRKMRLKLVPARRIPRYEMTNARLEPEEEP